jgi:hypothetical protein
LISSIVFTAAVAGHIHFGPVGTSLFVSAWFIFPDSFPAFILGVVLELAVKAVFAVPVCVASSAGTKMIAALWSPRVLFLRSVLEFCVSPVLEGSDFFFVVLGLRVAVLIDGCHRPGSFGTRFPLGVGHHLVHVIQRDGVLIVLGDSFLQIPW